MSLISQSPTQLTRQNQSHSLEVNFPDLEDTTESKSSPARGILIGFAFSLLIWAGIFGFFFR